MLNYKFINLSFVILFILAFSISETFAQETRSLSKFEGILLDGNFDIQIVKSSKNEVKIEGADAKKIKKLKTEVEGNFLKVELKNGNKSHKVIITVYHTEQLEYLSLLGAGSIEWNDELYSTRLDINIVGSGRVCGKIAVSNLKVKIKGSGEICLKGVATKQQVKIAGTKSGNYQAEDLKTEETEIKVSGPGSAKIYVTKILDIKILYFGNVYYKTDAIKLIKKSISAIGFGKAHGN